MKKVVKARVEIPQREWVEFELSLDSESGKVVEASWHAQGCHLLLAEAEKYSREIMGKKLEDLSGLGSDFSLHHSGLMMAEIQEKLLGRHQVPTDVEICHCRNVNLSVIDGAVMLGAHTPEKVTAWTTASSGCGTCRSEVQKIIDSRLATSVKKTTDRAS